MNKSGPIFECNSECHCSLETCQNRVSQKEDQSKNVKLISTSNKGYGVIVEKPILHPVHILVNMLVKFYQKLKLIVEYYQQKIMNIIIYYFIMNIILKQ